MASKDMSFIQRAPLNSWIAIDDAETRVLAVASSLQELEEKIKAEGFQDVVVWRTPPSWACPAY